MEVGKRKIVGPDINDKNGSLTIVLYNLMLCRTRLTYWTIVKRMIGNDQ